jgi:glutaredoxin
MKQPLLLALLTLTLAITPLAYGQVFRWVDADGRVHYGDIPPTSVDAQRRRMLDNSVETDKLSYEMKRAADISPVTLYVADNCKELCEQARSLLKKRQIPHTEAQVKTQEEIDALAVRLGGSAKVPALIVGRKPVSGFEEGEWTRTLDAAGYPK